MSFLESPRFPDSVAERGLVSGPAHLTEIIELASGVEQRRAVWSLPRQAYSIDVRNLTSAQMALVEGLFRAAQGRFKGFRLRDPYDYQVTGDAGLLGTGGVGTGLPTYQLYKRYWADTTAALRKIKKPIASGLSVLRAASPVSVGASPGNIAIDTTSGVITFVADQSRSISSHSVGAGHQFTLSSAFSPNLAIGGRIYVSGISGTAAATLNGIAHTITNVSSAVITVSTATTGLTASGGIAFFYPQPTQTLTWTGTFDTPVRFDSDRMAIDVARVSIGGSHTWDNIALIELL